MQLQVVQVNTHYSTAPQELWTELLPKDLQDQNFVSETQINESESSCVEVHLLEQSDLLLLQLLAEGGQARVYFARCKHFSTPVVVKRLKHRNVDLHRLQRRMETVMQTRKKNNSAICRVFGVGTDFFGNAWVVLERMGGDLRTLIDHRVKHLEDGQMPFDYNNAVTMMIDIARAMEDLHRCDLIPADLKASNILVTPVNMDPREEEVDGLQQALESMYFYVKIGDFETSDGIVGTRFWRAPEVLQALRDKAKSILSPAANVYSYGMLCYELLTGRIPFEECARLDYDVVFSRQRPELPAHVNLTMKELLHACWHMEARERPGWTSIIKTLKEELMLHPPGLQQPKWRAQPWIEMERREIEAAERIQGLETKLDALMSWEKVLAQELGVDFVTWKREVDLEILPIVEVIFTLRKWLRGDSTKLSDGMMMIDHTTRGDGAKTGDKAEYAFRKAWDLVKKTWTKHVGKGFHPRESGTDIICGLEIREEGQINGKKDTGRTVREIWDYETVEPCNLLGPTAEYWLKKILATSKKWKAFRGTLHAWHCEKEDNFLRWKFNLQQVLKVWEELSVSFHVWHVKSPIAFIAWQTLKKMPSSVIRPSVSALLGLDEEHSELAEDSDFEETKFEVCIFHYYN
ncbi:unnamed protein product [Sphagnum jensenii]|uniref:Protein kinase domain-containing protein n=1 Tax=Sphagnum jensenii TaxID=128206 RepID=A0ABP1ANS3_9BRYO